MVHYGCLSAARIGVSDLKAATKALQELVVMGFIAMTKEAHFSIKAADTSRARCWRLTFLFDAANRKSASNEWRDRRPDPKTRGSRRMKNGLDALKRYKNAIDQEKVPVLDFTTLDPVYQPNSVGTVEDSTTGKNGKGANQPSAIMVESSTHTAGTIGSVQSIRFAHRIRSEHCAAPMRSTFAKIAVGVVCAENDLSE